MSDRMKEICGNCGRRYGLHINQSCYKNLNLSFKPTGKYEGENMSDKIQMTEEQYKNMSRDIWGACTDAELHVVKQKGYIIKSELQQKVERVEASLKEYIDGHSVDILDTFKASIDVIQLLKQSHPEFKK